MHGANNISTPAVAPSVGFSYLCTLWEWHKFVIRTSKTSSGLRGYLVFSSRTLSWTLIFVRTTVWRGWDSYVALRLVKLTTRAGRHSKLQLPSAACRWKPSWGSPREDHSNHFHVVQRHPGSEHDSPTLSHRVIRYKPFLQKNMVFGGENEASWWLFQKWVKSYALCCPYGFLRWGYSVCLQKRPHEFWSGHIEERSLGRTTLGLCYKGMVCVTSTVGSSSIWLSERSQYTYKQCTPWIFRSGSVWSFDGGGFSITHPLRNSIEQVYGELWM